jgi:hypothetical protein
VTGAAEVAQGGLSAIECSGGNAFREARLQWWRGGGALTVGAVTHRRVCGGAMDSVIICDLDGAHFIFFILSLLFVFRCFLFFSSDAARTLVMFLQMSVWYQG